MTFEELVSEIKQLSVEERKQLIFVIVDSLAQSTSTRSPLEFEGIGESLHNNEDAQEYVNQLRSEWDQRP